MTAIYEAVLISFHALFGRCVIVCVVDMKKKTRHGHRKNGHDAMETDCLTSDQW